MDTKSSYKSSDRDAFQGVWETQKRGLGNRVLLELWKNDGVMTLGDLNRRFASEPAEAVVDAVLKARQFSLVDIDSFNPGATRVTLTEGGRKAVILD